MLNRTLQCTIKRSLDYKDVQFSSYTCDCENPKRSLKPAVSDERCESVLLELVDASGIVVLVVLGFTDNFKDSDPLSVSGLDTTDIRIGDRDKRIVFRDCI